MWKKKVFFVNTLGSNILKIFHQNIGGFTSKRDILEVTISELNTIGKRPDVICLSETFVRRGSECCLKLTGYDVATTYCRKNGKNRGGVCILLKAGTRYQEVTGIQEFAQDMIFECCGIKLIDYNILLLCIYRTPDSNVTSFLSALDEILHKYIKNSKSKIVLAGDLNINTLKPSTGTNYLIEIVNNYNLIIHVKEPTRKSSCIDHIISNFDKASYELHHLHLSDHDTAQMLYIPTKEKNVVPVSYYINIRDYSDENCELFRRHLECLTFTDVTSDTDTNSAMSRFHEILTTLYNLCFPIKKIKQSNNYKRPKWITGGLIQSCRTKRQLRYQYYSLKTADKKEEYKCYSKMLRRCLKVSRKLHNNKLIMNSKNKGKMSWKIVKDEVNCLTNNEFIKLICYL